MTTRQQQRNLRLRFFNLANKGNSGKALEALFKRNKLNPNVIPESWTKKGPELITKSIVEGAPKSSMTMHRRKPGAKRKVGFAADIVEQDDRKTTCPPRAKPVRTTGEQSKSTMILQASGPPYFGRCKEMGQKGEGCKKKEEDPLQLGACMKTIYRFQEQMDGTKKWTFKGYEEKQDNPWYAKTADGAGCCFPTKEEANQSMLRQPIRSMPTPGASMKRSDSGDSVGSHDFMLEELQREADKDLTIEDLQRQADEEHPLTEEEELKIEELRIHELERRLAGLSESTTKPPVSTGTAAFKEGEEVWGDFGGRNPFVEGSDFSEEGGDRSLVSSRTSSLSSDDSDMAALRRLARSDSDSSMTSEAAEEEVAKMQADLDREDIPRPRPVLPTQPGDSINWCEKIQLTIHQLKKQAIQGMIVQVDPLRDEVHHLKLERAHSPTTKLNKKIKSLESKISKLNKKGTDLFNNQTRKFLEKVNRNLVELYGTEVLQEAGIVPTDAQFNTLPRGNLGDGDESQLGMTMNNCKKIQKFLQENPDKAPEGVVWPKRPKADAPFVGSVAQEIAEDEEEEESAAVKTINDTISDLEQKITTSKKEIQKLKTKAKPLKKDNPERKRLMLKIKQLLTTKRQNEGMLKNLQTQKEALIQMEKMNKALEGNPGKPKAKKAKKKTGLFWGGSRKRKRRKNKKSTRKRRR